MDVTDRAELVRFEHERITRVIHQLVGQLTNNPFDFLTKKKNIRMLCLDRNKFKEIPMAVTKLRSLVCLHMNDNRLVKLHQKYALKVPITIGSILFQSP